MNYLKTNNKTLVILIIALLAAFFICFIKLWKEKELQLRTNSAQKRKQKLISLIKKQEKAFLKLKRLSFYVRFFFRVILISLYSVIIYLFQFVFGWSPSIDNFFNTLSLLALPLGSLFFLINGFLFPISLVLRKLEKAINKLIFRKNISLQMKIKMNKEEVQFITEKYNL